MDANLAMTHFTIGAVTVAALQWVKASPWFPWIVKGKTTLLRIISAAVAAATAVGIGVATELARVHNTTVALQRLARHRSAAPALKVFGGDTRVACWALDDAGARGPDS